jgi:K+-sensing histidine kinase KdpD
LLFDKEKEHLAEQITHQKELLFTKRIYHTHHKAEKVMGFIKEDLRRLSAGTIEEVKERVIRYSNFIARVIYDMKWYDPPVQTIRGPLFRTNINEVLQFLVQGVFLRVATDHGQYRFTWDLDPCMPPVSVNEFVVWEAFEPVIQNCLDHAGVKDLVITLRTTYHAETRSGEVVIADNGKGIMAELLERNERGIQRLFLEDVSTKKHAWQHSGYGCYLAHEIATQRCGWRLEAGNAPEGGSRFVFTIADL